MIQFESSRSPFELVIALCWAVFFVVWAVSAPFVKRTVERPSSWARPLALIGVILVWGIVRWMPQLRQELWPRTAAVGVLADLLTVLGLAVAIWARLTLGRNWSGTITYKEGHELIRRGPYAHVRHPIYSGLLLMGLGTAVASTRLSSIVLLAGAFLLLAIKARLEERLMLRHFPEAYAEYRRRVRALIPYVW